MKGISVRVGKSRFCVRTEILYSVMERDSACLLGVAIGLVLDDKAQRLVLLLWPRFLVIVGSSYGRCSPVSDAHSDARPHYRLRANEKKASLMPRLWRFLLGSHAFPAAIIVLLCPALIFMSGTRTGRRCRRRRRSGCRRPCERTRRTW